MHASTKKRIEVCLKIIIALAAIVLIFLCALLIKEYRHVRRLNYIAAHGSLLSALHARGPIGANDISYVEAWMTFDYINHLFSLPTQYMQTTLTITDTRYPHLTIAEYTEDQGLNRSAFLIQVQNAIRTYLSPKQ